MKEAFIQKHTDLIRILKKCGILFVWIRQKNQTVLLYRKIEEGSQICAKKKPQLGPIKWFFHYNKTPAQQTLSVKMFKD
jgi:hypothetical protein